MIGSERREAIMNELRSRGMPSVAEFAPQLGVAAVTRRLPAGRRPRREHRRRPFPAQRIRPMPELRVRAFSGPPRAEATRPRTEQETPA
ncbi:hypothetical protein DSC45_21600 [Streptomyces sp. YIM 130001]|uniref:hypothetical protein n=1 Tax=Streptomyces sp. YIM 130001 TaxID=2259644 RepID=UPI000ED4B92C|nr:hypothetical protein [Streptomyces sp. YIM 130001]RII13899.1 hypothetical protein DSC45_21600 [Streptomyces sp. YIM 130001]